MSARVLFLDVDGVLNAKNFFPAPGMKPPWIVDLNKVQSLNHVLLQTEIKIVVSSTWRLNCTTPNADVFCERSYVDRALIHDDWRTIQGATGVRWVEINEWLGRHPEVEAACVVDDNSDAELLGTPFVQTDGELGLTYEQLGVILRKLGYTLQGSHVVQRRGNWKPQGDRLQNVQGEKQ